MQAEFSLSTLLRVLEDSAGESYLFDAETFRFVFVNRSARVNLGYSMEELRSLSPWDLKPKFTQESFRASVAPLLRGKTSAINFETEHRRKDGSNYDALVNLQLLDTDDGRLFNAAIQDVSERKAAETNLQTITRRLDAILNNTTMAIIMMDHRQHCIFMNHAAEELTGYKLAETQGRPLHDVVHHTYPDGRHFPIDECEIDRAFPENNQMQGEEIFVHKNGRFYPVGFTASPMRDESGRPMGTVIEARDITEELRARKAVESFNETLRLEVQAAIGERQKIEQQLNQTQKMEAIGQLTGGVAHDFNNLLQVIGGSLGLLERHVSDIPRARQLIENARAGVGRGAKLASQLLSFARRQPLDPVAVNLARIVREMDGMLRRVLGDGIQIETVIAGGLWNSFIDRTQFESALLNLAINARDAMGGFGRLTVEVGNASLDENYAAKETDVRPGQYVCLAITDTGCGIAPEVIDRVLEPFFTTKAEGEGTGLGLSMVYGFIKQSGGHVKIYSEVGQGTTIRLYLPRSRREEVVNTRDFSDPVRGGTERILVVEDDATVRQTTVEMLKELGYEVLQAGNADAAMTVINSGIAIDVLFTDVVMPGSLRAPELARLVRAQRPDVAVLYTSGYTQNAIVHAGRLDEDVDLLSKPFSRDDLARKIRQVLANRSRDEGPADTSSSPIARQVADRSDAPTPTRFRILVVEDEPLILMTTTEILEGFGHEPLEASSVAEARALLAREAVDILLVDDNLPDGSGFDFVLEAFDPTQHRGVILASGRPLDPQNLRGLQPVIAIGKPYFENELRSALDRIERHQR